MRHGFYWLIFLGGIFCAQGSEGPPAHQLTLVNASWCPYVCTTETGTTDGIAIRYIRELLAPENVEVKLTLLPWNRALQLAHDGEVDGLLTTGPTESPNLLFAEHPTGFYQACFFTLQDSSFVYRNADSLKHVTLGMVENYAYGPPLDDIVEKRPFITPILFINHTNVMPTMVGLLKKKRIEAFPEDHFVTRYFEKQGSIPALRNAGCMQTLPYFTGFYPSEKGKLWRQWLNDKLAADQNRQSYQQIVNAFID